MRNSIFCIPPLSVASLFKRRPTRTLVENSWFIATSNLHVLEYHTSNCKAAMDPVDTVEAVASTLTSSLALEYLPPAKDSVSSITFFTASLWYWLWVFFKIMNYVVVIIPTIVLNMLQMSFQITLSLLSILIGLVVTVSLCYFIVRHKYLTRYSKDTLPPKQENLGHNTRGIDYVTELRKRRGNDRSKTYLDEFLSAIKVFGYLERPVFHELTKNMTTQRLEADEILYLDEKLGFSIVVEGTVQVYTKMQDKHGAHFEFDEDNDKADKDDILIIRGQHYQLLNEVKSGSALSSLLSTLDLFHTRNTAISSPAFGPPLSQLRRANIARPKPMLHSRFNSRHSSTSTPIEPLSLSPDRSTSPLQGKPDDLRNYFNSPRINATQQPLGESTVGTPLEHGSFPIYDELPEVVARPKPLTSNNGYPSTATIAIIPGLAFQRVQTRYPKATSHIVTMVLTRLYKVTMNTVNTYLGLIREVFDAEIALNAINEECKLPSYLYDGVIENYNLQRADERDGELENSTHILSKSKKRQKVLHRESSSRYVVLASRSKPSHPGDLLSSVPLSRTSDYGKLQNSSMSDESGTLTSWDSQRHPNPNEVSKYRVSPVLKKSSLTRKENIRNRSFSDEREETEETSLRIAIVENLFKLLGIDENSSQLNMSGVANGQISADSSMVGLSSLMSDHSLPVSIERNIFDAGKERSSSFSSPYLGYRTSLSHNSQKFYNTIYHSSKTDQSEANGLSASDRPPSSSEVNFSTVKNAFSKHIEVKYYKPGHVIVQQNEPSPGLFYVIHGGLDIIHDSHKDNKYESVSKRLYSVKPGGLAGYLSSIVGIRSLVSIKSSKDEGAIVAHISKNDLTRLTDKFYFLQLPVAAKLKSLLPSLIVTIDFALEWCHIPAGGVLCSQGDLANGFHVVLSGRFRVVKNKKMKVDNDDDVPSENLIDESNVPKHHQDDDDFEVLGEYGHGASIGEVEVLTASRRTNSLIAVRDSETARIPRTLFEMLSLQNPSIMVKVSRIVANRSLEASKRDRTNTLIATTSKSSFAEINNDYKTITILPTTNGLPVREFADKLVHALKALDRHVIALDRTSTLSHLGRHAFDERLAQLRLSGYFAYLEEEYQTVVYICDSPLKSSWTSTCISQGDCILLLADAEDYETAANVGDYERLLLKLKTTARTELCLLHPEPSVFPGSTSIWLKNRIWVQGHHHIHMEVIKQHNEKPAKKKQNMLTDLAVKLSTKANPNIKMKFENVKSRAMNSLIKLNNRVNKADDVPVLYKNDFMRLARILSNEAVGLVLGGGGSRGISHVGVVTALEKHGIPVDLIGGTSIGSFVGGLYAKENNIVSIYGMTKKFSRRIGAVWRMLFDLTYPVTSYITGHEFNRGIWKVFGVHEIEDFWIRYFCNSTNITNSTIEIHERGYAWRFIRASMSLAGLLPPITYNGLMLLDGGYLDNLPVMEMKVRGAKHIVAVDVGSVDDRTPMNYGDTLSGFWVLFNRWNPFSKHPDVPNMMDIQLRLAYVASVNALEAAKKMPGIMYLRPPIDDYATLDFMKFDEIYNVGLAYADEIIGKWAREGKLPKFAGVSNLKLKEGHPSKSMFRRNSI